MVDALQLDLRQLQTRHQPSSQSLQLCLQLLLDLIETLPLSLYPLGGLRLHRRDLPLDRFDLVSNQTVDLCPDHPFGPRDLLTYHSLEALRDGLVEVALYRKLRSRNGPAQLSHNLQIRETRNHPPDHALDFIQRPTCGVGCPADLLRGDGP